MRSEHNDSQAAVIGGLSARPGETQQGDRQPATQSSPSFCFHGWFYTGPPANNPAQNRDRAALVGLNARISCLPRLGRPGKDGGMEQPDQMRDMFRMQQSLNERIGVKTSGMSDEEKTRWLLNYCRAMTQEIAELTDSVPWKWWAKYQKFDEQNARVEVVDLFHFLISAAQVLGMSADDVYQAYLKKNAVNFQRQETGYIRKDEGDSRHI